MVVEVGDGDVAGVGTLVDDILNVGGEILGEFNRERHLPEVGGEFNGLEDSLSGAIERCRLRKMLERDPEIEAGGGELETAETGVEVSAGGTVKLTRTHGLKCCGKLDETESGFGDGLDCGAGGEAGGNEGRQGRTEAEWLMVHGESVDNRRGEGSGWYWLVVVVYDWFGARHFCC